MTSASAPAPASQPKKSRRKNKQLPDARRRYYVGDPVIVLSLADYERLIDHLTDIAQLPRKTQHQQAAIRERHSKLLKLGRDDIRAAKHYYHITATQNPETC